MSMTQVCDVFSKSTSHQVLGVILTNGYILKYFALVYGTLLTKISKKKNVVHT